MTNSIMPYLQMKVHSPYYCQISSASDQRQFHGRDSEMTAYLLTNLVKNLSFLKNCLFPGLCILPDLQNLNYHCVAHQHDPRHNQLGVL